jgi:hypothetical protein
VGPLEGAGPGNVEGVGSPVPITDGTLALLWHDCQLSLHEAGVALEFPWADAESTPNEADAMNKQQDRETRSRLGPTHPALSQRPL